MSEPLLPPIGMLAELTHRCPLQCPYCSNPLELLKANRELDTQTWLDLFLQAADLGVLQVHLSGGEPTLRRDLEQLIAGLSARGVYTNLITAGVGIAEGRIEAFAEAGLDHLQLSFQGARPATTDRIGNHKGGHEEAGDGTPGSRGRPAAHHQRADPSPQHRGGAGIHRSSAFTGRGAARDRQRAVCGLGADQSRSTDA